MRITKTKIGGCDMKKLFHEIHKEFSDFDDVEVNRSGKHLKITLRRGDDSRTFTASSSPKNMDVTIKNIRQDVRRYW